MKPSANRNWVWMAGLALGVFSLACAAWAQDYSRARIVRLSFVEGQVTVQRPDVQEWAQAPVNTPLEEGFKLSTGEDSFAEVEFENGSTVRLGQLTLLEFTQLGLLPSGSKLNHLTLSQGYATFHALMEGGDQYEVATPNGTLAPQNKAMFRVDLDQGLERVEVFKGEVGVSGSLGDWTLTKNQVLELRPGAESPSNLTEGITTDAWDNWVSEREQSPAAAPSSPSPQLYSDNVSDLLYGWNDLSTYGMWSYMPSYGYGWMPTVVPGGWNPYTLGRWCWYPGFGYTWISSEPWGWLPYHYGSWTFLPGTGWMWFPGNFGTWSPALVTWYSGPGWIGWVPGRHHLPGPFNSCSAGRPCGAAVSTTAFQNGAEINPRAVMPVNPLDGHRIDHPGVEPASAGRLPGPPVSHPTWIIPREGGAGATSGIRVTRMVNTESPVKPSATIAPAGQNSSANVQRTVIVPAPRVTAPSATIVYDPSSGRYVNSHTMPDDRVAPTPSPTTTEGQSAKGPATPRASSGPAPKVGPGEKPNMGWIDHPTGASEEGRPAATAPRPVRSSASSGGRSSQDVTRVQPAPARSGSAAPIRSSGGGGGGRSGGEFVRGGGQVNSGGASARGGGASSPSSSPAAGGIRR